MRNLIRFTVLLIFAAFVTATTSNAQARGKENFEDTVDEYFKLLTSKDLPILDKYKNRASIIKEADYKNRYLLLANEEWKGWGEMAVFSKTDGGHLIVVTQYDCKQKYPSYPYYSRSNCAGNIRFLTLEKNALVEAKNLMPDLKSLQLYGFYEKKTKRLADSDDKLMFELPRERKDILIKLAGETVYSLLWNGQKFEGSYVD